MAILEFDFYGGARRQIRRYLRRKKESRKLQCLHDELISSVIENTEGAGFRYNVYRKLMVASDCRNMPFNSNIGSRIHLEFSMFEVNN